MPARHRDWLRQAQRDLDQAKHSLEGGFYEWACFASQQAAEKAVKAVYQKLGAEAWGHVVSELLFQLPEAARPSADLIDKGKELDQFYIPTRYPNQHAAGAPLQFYTKGQARRAVEYAAEIIAWCQGLVVPEG